MKKNILIIGLAGVLGIGSTLTSCAPDYQTEFAVMTLFVPDKSQASIILPLGGGQQEIEVQTNVPLDQWKAASNAEWCTIEKQDKKVIVSAGENNIYKQRQAEVTISYGHQSYSVKVNQFGNEPIILVGPEGQRDGYIEVVEAESTTVTIPIATNLELDNIVIPDTCEWLRLSAQPEPTSARAEGKDVNRHNLTFMMDQNTDTVVRYCSVILQSSQNYNYVTTFVIKQRERGYIVEVEDEKKTYQVKAAGETITIPFLVNGPSKAYTYEVETAAQSWITPAPATRAMREAYESFVIEPNILETPRVGKVVFRSTDPNRPNEFTVTVTQDLFIPAPPVGIVHATATPGAGFIQLNWETPEQVDYTKIKITYYDKVFKENKEIVLTNNKTTSFVIEDTYQCAGDYVFTIKTYGPTEMETEHPLTVKGTSNESAPRPVVLTAAMLSANASQPGDGGGLPALLDSDTNTFYHTMYNSLSPGSQPHYVQINLQEPLQNLRFEYDGRKTANNNGDVTRVGIWGSDTGADDSWTKIGTEKLSLPTSAGGHSQPDENVMGDKPYKHIRFTPEARRDKDPLNPAVAGSAWWNMSNLYLYKINKHDEAWARKELGI